MIPGEQTTKLLYAPGKPSGIKELIEVEGKTRLFRFFPGSRVDGLVKRYEIMHKKVSAACCACVYDVIHVLTVEADLLSL